MIGKNQNHTKSWQIVEVFVSDWMKKKNYLVLHRSYRGPGFELDIVALKDRTFVVTEVKLRRWVPYLDASPASLIPRKKKACLKKGALAYLSDHDTIDYHTIRLDLALVVNRSKDPYRLGDLHLVYFTGLDPS